MSAPISVYLDYQATTPVDPRVLEIMLPFFSEGFANPHSVQHGPGRDAADATDKARAQIAQAIGAEAREIVFTSGATEANNLAIKGAVRFAMAQGQGGHIVTVATEHKCVLEASADMEAEGARITVLPVGDDGLVDLGELESALDEETCLVSVMAVNNETGVIQPLDEIGAITRPRGILLHTDAAQAVGKIALDVEVANVDLMSMTAHK
ncbi:MAG: aminotransferase class V-fold PLP-dependent enzyme, partial [Alphaproteobacteria bacterium]|nr:aminotransferase class V-fold PLP-dependent enzyme [Alphaproteobacteria bacterium]